MENMISVVIHTDYMKIKPFLFQLFIFVVLVRPFLGQSSSQLSFLEKKYFVAEK